MSQTMIINHVIIKALVEEFKRQPECLGETTEKKHNFFGIDKKQMIIRIIYQLKQGLWQAHYQILLKIFPEEFIKLNANKG